MVEYIPLELRKRVGRLKKAKNPVLVGGEVCFAQTEAKIFSNFDDQFRFSPSFPHSFADFFSTPPHDYIDLS